MKYLIIGSLSLVGAFVGVYLAGVVAVSNLSLKFTPEAQNSSIPFSDGTQMFPDYTLQDAINAQN